MPILEARNISKFFGGVRAVRDCSIAVEPRTITALIGPNGAGKTTLFNVLNGFLKPDSGTVFVRDKDVSAFPLWKRSRAGLSRTFQLSRIFKNLSLRENLLLALREDDDRFFSMVFGSPTDMAYEPRIADALKIVGLDIDLARPASDLSYGQQKLFDLARAILNPHSILLLDEPVAGINPVLREKLAGILKTLRDQGETVLLIEHDMDFVRQVADAVIVMDQGSVLTQGDPETVLRDPKVLDAYLGEAHP
jgi:ABC-type branched-subunit amino acid transport system ATPase component